MNHEFYPNKSFGVEPSATIQTVDSFVTSMARPCLKQSQGLSCQSLWREAAAAPQPAASCPASSAWPSDCSPWDQTHGTSLPLVWLTPILCLWWALSSPSIAHCMSHLHLKVACPAHGPLSALIPHHHPHGSPGSRHLGSGVIDSFPCKSRLSNQTVKGSASCLALCSHRALHHSLRRTRSFNGHDRWAATGGGKRRNAEGRRVGGGQGRRIRRGLEDGEYGEYRVGGGGMV